MFEGGYKLDLRLESAAVFFKVHKAPKTITRADQAGSHLELHPSLKHSLIDFVVKQARYAAARSAPSPSRRGRPLCSWNGKEALSSLVPRSRAFGGIAPH